MVRVMVQIVSDLARWGKVADTEHHDALLDIAELAWGEKVDSSDRDSGRRHISRNFQLFTIHRILR